MKKNSNKKAFTLLELVFVIVVMGIVVVALMPKIDSTANLRDAAIGLVNDIRYTQHLAMLDDHISTNDVNWSKKRWTLIFGKSDYSDQKYAYTIFADVAGKSSGNPDVKSEIAKNPLNNGKYLSGGYSGISGLDIRDEDSFVGTKSYNLGYLYGIKDVVFSSSCSYHGSKRVSFDHVGRPLKGNLTSYDSPYPKNRLLEEQCKITLIDKSDENISIYIEPETGFVHL